MRILEVYLLVIVIIGLWHFGLVPTIRYVFKNFVTVLLRDTVRKVTLPSEKKHLLQTHKGTVNIIAHAQYREFMALLPIAQDMSTVQNAHAVGKGHNLSEPVQEYLKNTAMAIVVCLYMCTPKGFLHIFWFMVRRLMASLFSAKFAHFSKAIAQPATILLLLLPSLSTPHSVAMHRNNPEAIFSAGSTSLTVER